MTLKLKILITIEIIKFSFLVKLYIDPRMVLGYLILRFKPWSGFRLHFYYFLINALDAREQSLVLNNMIY